MIKTSVILFVLFYLVTAHSQQTIDKLNSNQLKLPKETISKALSIDATGQVKSSATSDVELGYLSGASSNVQGQINDKANDVNVVHLTGDESIAGVKTLTGKLVTSSTVNASIPCPVMTQTQRDTIATPVTGDCVFNSNTSLSNIYDGSIWKAMGGSGGGIGLWVTSNGYAVDDVVIESNNIYICLTAHTSGTFAIDLASLYWLRLSTDVTGATGLLPLATGGTNKSITASDGSIVYSDADSLELLSPGTSGQILQTNGAAAPTFVNKSISGKAQNTTAVTLEEMQVPNNLLTATDTNKYLNETGNTNILSNPSFEHSTFSTSWTNSAGTFTQETSVVIDGKASAKLVPSSQTMSLTQSSTLYANQFADGVQGLAMVRIKSDIALKVCSIQAGTVSTTNCVTTNTDSKWGLYKVPFILGATSNGISISSNGTLVTGTVYIDDAFVGVTDIAQISSAIGPWTSYTPTLTNFSASSTSMQWRQVGQSIQIRGSITLSGAPTGVQTVSLPSGLTHSATSATARSGIVQGLDAGVSFHLGVAESSAGSSTFSFVDDAIINNWTPTVPFTWGATDSIIIPLIEFPITQFSGSISTYSSTNADTDWASCGHTTSDFTGFGTVTAIETQCRREGSNYIIRGRATIGTPTSTEARLALKFGGSALVSRSTTTIPNIQTTGIYFNASTATTHGGAVLIEPSTAYMTFGHSGTFSSSSINAGAKANGDAVITVAGIMQINASIPINGWENSNIIIGQFNGLQSCPNTLACTDTFSAKVTSAGVVSDENVNWINGNFTVSPIGTFSASFNTSIFTATANCVATPSLDPGSSVSSTISSISSSAIVVNTDNTAGAASLAFTLVCQKSGADYIGKTAMAVASDQNLRTPGVTKAVVYSFSRDAAGVVSNESGDIVFGNCTNADPSVCTFNSSIFSGVPVCTVSASVTTSNFYCKASVTSSATTIQCTNAGTGANVNSSTVSQVICHGVSP